MSSTTNMECDIFNGVKIFVLTKSSHVWPDKYSTICPDAAYIKLLYKYPWRKGMLGSKYFSLSNNSWRVKSDLYQILSCRDMPVRCESISRIVTFVFSSSL